ncbi:unnamed protein product [Rangifer tarandus platyrhynchus]|uniref:Uncharacterized protein n=1 Tax=Rangifer tarandus platyrhynchus TaxID=3082113 RepID=A0ABN8YUM7_RANTA|nr:unnamed protein product [Rangifer tarandus platyrhynchus]
MAPRGPLPMALGPRPTPSGDPGRAGALGGATPSFLLSWQASPTPWEAPQATDKNEVRVLKTATPKHREERDFPSFPRGFSFCSYFKGEGRRMQSLAKGAAPITGSESLAKGAGPPLPGGTGRGDRKGKQEGGRRAGSRSASPR